MSYALNIASKSDCTVRDRSCGDDRMDRKTAMSAVDAIVGLLGQITGISPFLWTLDKIVDYASQLFDAERSLQDQIADLESEISERRQLLDQVIAAREQVERAKSEASEV